MEANQKTEIIGIWGKASVQSELQSTDFTNKRVQNKQQAGCIKHACAIICFYFWHL